jgi:hypothetical protein
MTGKRFEKTFLNFFLKTNGLILHISWNHIVQDVTLTNQDKKEKSVHDTIKSYIIQESHTGEPASGTTRLLQLRARLLIRSLLVAPTLQILKGKR